MDRDLTRRTVVKGAAAVAGASAIPENVFAAAGYEGAPLERKDLDFFNLICSDASALKKFQDNPSWREVLSVIRVIAGSSTAKLEKKETKLHRGAITLSNEKGHFAGQGTVLRVLVEGVHRFAVVTTAHVVEDGARTPEGAEWKKHKKGYDLAACEVSESYARSKGALDVDPQKNIDATRKVGITQGRDNDSGVFVTKTCASHLSPRLSPAILFDALKIQRTTKGKPVPFSGEELRLAALAPHEAIANMKGELPWDGMSGAAVISDEELVGVASSVITPDFKTEKYALELLTDREFVNELITDLFDSKPRFAAVKS